MRLVDSLPLEEADEMGEIELTGGVIAEHEDLYMVSTQSDYYIGKAKTEEEAHIGDGVDTFEVNGHTVSPGTVLFQANALLMLMDPETREAYCL